jgi:hypothetical protein
MWQTRYLGILCYSGMAGLLIIQDNVINSLEASVAILAPISAFIIADQYKHRHQDIK